MILLKRIERVPIEGWRSDNMRFLLLFILTFLPNVNAEAARVKDVGSFHGVRENQLVGSGLVVGLQRTGDSPRNEAAIRTLAGRLQGLGVSLQMDEIASRNIAMVMVTATIKSDHRTGARLDVTVASTGDASSLEGGQLLLTPLLATDGKVYAVAEGALVVGGYNASASGSANRKNSPTSGRIASGAIVEREVPSTLNYDQMTQVDFVLKDPDFTTALRVEEALNQTLGEGIAHATTSATVTLKVPEEFVGQFARFAAAVEVVDVAIDTPARVVINERTGTVVMGADVRVSAVAIAHGGLTIEVRRTPVISQPGVFSRGETVSTAMMQIEVNEEDGKLRLVEGVDIGTLVSALNTMGVKPRDLMVILQAIKSSGSLHAELVTI